MYKRVQQITVLSLSPKLATMKLIIILLSTLIILTEANYITFYKAFSGTYIGRVEIKTDGYTISGKVLLLLI